MDMDNTTSNSSYKLRYDVVATSIYVCAYAMIFITGTIGNILVVLVVTRSRRMRTVTNVFLMNLAIADLLANLCCIPFTLVGHIFEAWILGALVCKAVTYLQGVSVAASVHTLVAISVERCLAVIWPLNYRFRKRHAYYTISVLWVTSFTLTLPWAMYFHLEEGNQTCTEDWPSKQSGNLYFLFVHLLICYVIPMLVIGICYTLIGVTICKRQTPGETSNGTLMNRSKVKATKMILTVVVFFALCWLPLYFLVTCWRFELLDLDSVFGDVLSLGHAFAAAQFLSNVNSCINPVLYHYMDKRFRTAFRLFFCPAEDTGLPSRSSSKASIKSVNGGGAMRYYRASKLASLNEDKLGLSELTKFQTCLAEGSRLSESQNNCPGDQGSNIYAANVTRF